MSVSMEGPAGYRSVLGSLMPNLSSQLRISPEEATLSEHELREVQRFLSLNREEEDVSGGDRGKGLKDPSSSGKRCRVLKDLTVSESNIGTVGNGSLLRKQNLTLPLFMDGKENISSSSSSSTSSSSTADVLHRNRLPRRERCSRITSRRRPFVADLKNLDTNASEEYRIQDVYAFWEAVEERDAAEAIINKLKGDNKVFPESNRRKLGERRKFSQRRTSRLRGFTVELPLCVGQMTEEVEQQEDSCYSLSGNSQLIDDHIPISQTVDSYHSDVTFEKIAHLEEERNSLRNDILSPHAHLEIPSVSISSPHMDSNNEIYNERKDSSGGYQVSEIASGCQGEKLENRCTIRSEGRTREDVVEVADLCDMLVGTPFVMRKKLQLKMTPNTSPTPLRNPLAGICFSDEENKRRLDFTDKKSSSDSEEPQLPLDLDTPDLEQPKTSLDSTSHLEPIDSVDIIDSSDVEPEPSIRAKTREAEETTLTLLASSMATENTVEEALSTEISIAKLPSMGSVQQSPSLSSGVPLKKTQNRKRINAEPRRNSLAGAGMKWDAGVRRSTRIRSKPLDWWKGERFLRGRIHKSLVTVIGIKYASNSPCDPKKRPKFKVESYVPEEYLKLVEFAAL